MRYRHIVRTAAAAALLFGVAVGSTAIELPPAGQASPASIRECESQVAKLPGVKKVQAANGTGYTQINPGSDSFAYLFTSEGEPAHPAMIKVTIHPMRDPLHPQKDEVEFHESYASTEAKYVAWRKRVLFEFGRGFAEGAYEAARKQPAGSHQ